MMQEDKTGNPKPPSCIKSARGVSWGKASLFEDEYGPNKAPIAPAEQQQVVNNVGVDIEVSEKERKHKSRRSGRFFSSRSLSRTFSTVMYGSPPKQETVPRPKTAGPTPDLKIPTRKETCDSRFWASFSRRLTFFIPDRFIFRDGSEAKQAWREKVAIFVIMVVTSGITVGLFGFVPLFLCAESSHYSWEDVQTVNDGVLTRHREEWTVIHGLVYDVKQFMSSHPGGGEEVQKFVGQDASKLFPRTPPADLPENCLRPNLTITANLTEAVCNRFDREDLSRGTLCHNFTSGLDGIQRTMGKYRHGTLVYSMSALASQSDFQYIVIRDRVYNVTSYLDANKEEDVDAPTAILHKMLSEIIFIRTKKDEDKNATEFFEKVFKEPGEADAQQACLDHLFFQGEIDQRGDPVCEGFQVAMYFALIATASILVLQVLCSLFYVFRRTRNISADTMKNRVMIMVPCYNEGVNELGKTIKSVLETTYPEENKVMIIVCDGVITGRGESCSTPETIANMLGYKVDMAKDAAHLYTSIGANTRNRAFVYHGTYKKDDRELKYVVVVKCGTAKERSSPRAGNRGKRDSQLIMQGLFNRVHHGRVLNELDIALCRAFQDLNVTIEDLKFLMALDADTRVAADSVGQLVHSMEERETILACCGETKVDNKSQSWVTVLQVYEYFSSHHMKKAFESLFGTVTCLPGCFTMYRIKSNDGRPLIADDWVLGHYSRNDIESLHEKNLYHLGEDRMLTTLLLMHFPGMMLSFVPEAKCWTIVPHTFKILLSQRRRWINSTFHNMWELLKVRTLCGVCFFSMKTIVAADMISTMILPASLVYAIYFLYTVIVEGEALSQTLVLVYALIIGSQMIVFVLRSRWSYFFWFIAFLILGVPVFYFILPLYSFWHMDDLSWGQTRQVAATNDGTGDDKEKKEGGEDAEASERELPMVDTMTSTDTELGHAPDAPEGSFSTRKSGVWLTPLALMRKISHPKRAPVVVQEHTDEGGGRVRVVDTEEV